MSFVNNGNLAESVDDDLAKRKIFEGLYKKVQEAGVLFDAQSLDTIFQCKSPGKYGDHTNKEYYDIKSKYRKSLK